MAGVDSAHRPDANRKDDGLNLLVGPKNHDKLHLRGCAKACTTQALVKYEDEGGLEQGRTWLNLFGTDGEGFSLPAGLCAEVNRAWTPFPGPPETTNKR